jgi:hypothetical protein
MYTAWQREDDPARFVHLFEFADEAAHEVHGSSEAVRRFESVYVPECDVADFLGQMNPQTISRSRRW